MARRQSILTTAALAVLITATPAQAVIHLSFGLYTSNKPTTMVKQFRPVLDLVEQRTSENLGTDVEIRIQVAKDYEQGIAHLASGKVDFSRFGPASYIEAKRANSGLRILAMERVRGDKVFYGIIAVNKDSPITSVEQLRGASFAFGNDQSTIGRYLSQLFLRNHGILSADLSRFEYLGRHDTVGTAVGAGHFDAGALNEATYSKLVAKGVPIRELARFPNVTKPWIAREGLPERLYKALQDALLAIDDPAVVALLKADGFVAGEDADFSDIRAAIEMNGKFFEPPSTGDEKAVATAEEDGGVDAAGDANESSFRNAVPDNDADEAIVTDAGESTPDESSTESGTAAPTTTDSSSDATAPNTTAESTLVTPAPDASLERADVSAPEAPAGARTDLPTPPPVSEVETRATASDESIAPPPSDSAAPAISTDHPGRAATPQPPVVDEAVPQSVERSAALTASVSHADGTRRLP